MKWIYGEIRSIYNQAIQSYRINPRYIIAVDLNDRKMIVDGLNEKVLYYPKEYDDEIYNLVYEFDRRKEYDSN